MCGRVFLFSSAGDIAAEVDATGPVPNTEPTMDVAPTDEMLVLIFDRDARERRLVKMKFGLIPPGAVKWKAEAVRYINARSEKVETTHPFKHPWAEGRRGLVMTNGFYEWARNAKGKTGQRYAIRRKSLVRTKERYTALGCVWNVGMVEDALTYSCSVLTTAPNDLVMPIHDRMPVLVAEKDWPKWLGEEPATAQDLKAMMDPYPADDMETIPVKRQMPKAGSALDIAPFKEELF